MKVVVHLERSYLADDLYCAGLHWLMEGMKFVVAPMVLALLITLIGRH